MTTILHFPLKLNPLQCKFAWPLHSIWWYEGECCPISWFWAQRVICVGRGYDSRHETNRSLTKHFGISTYFLAFAVKHVWVNLLENETHRAKLNQPSYPRWGPRHVRDQPRLHSCLTSLQLTTAMWMRPAEPNFGWAEPGSQPADPWTKTNVYCHHWGFEVVCYAALLGQQVTDTRFKLLFSYIWFKQATWAQNIFSENW